MTRKERLIVAVCTRITAIMFDERTDDAVKVSDLAWALLPDTTTATS